MPTGDFTTKRHLEAGGANKELKRFINHVNALFYEQAVTATADGLTTGLIDDDTVFVVITSASANNIATLPASDVGRKIRGWVGANGCELRTPAASGATINNVDSDGTNEAAIPATTYFELDCVAADTWILRAWTELGAPITAIVPDAA
jgi:hypothetical protein